MKSLLVFVALFGVYEAYRRPYAGPGVCPPASRYSGICLFDPEVNCLQDSECAWGEKCCPEGCGKVCKVALPDSSPIHSGYCPEPTHRLGPCVLVPGACNSDAQCPLDHKCCKEGCNSVCKPALHRGK